MDKCNGTTTRLMLLKTVARPATCSTAAIEGERTLAKRLGEWDIGWTVVVFVWWLSYGRNTDYGTHNCCDLVYLDARCCCQSTFSSLAALLPFASKFSYSLCIIQINSYRL